MKKIIILITSINLLACSNDHKNQLVTNLNTKKELNNITQKSDETGKVDIIKGESQLIILNESNQIIESNPKIKDTNYKKIDISMIPTTFSFKYEIKPNNKHSIAIISPLNNDYLKYIVKSIDELKNTNVYILVPSIDNSEFNQIWCSDNQSAALTNYLINNQIINKNVNCNKDGIEYINNYVKSNFSESEFPLIIFDDGNFVKNSYNASTKLINLYNNESE